MPETTSTTQPEASTTTTVPETTSTTQPVATTTVPEEEPTSTTTPEPEVTTTVPETTPDTLPRTGPSDTGSLLLLAGILALTGLSLVAGTREKQIP